MGIIKVELDARAYSVQVQSGLLSQSALIRQCLHGQHVLVVSNETVAPLYAGQLQPALDGLQTSLYLLPDGESHKTFDNVGRVMAALAAMGASRDASVIALGGGVVGDLAGFSASLWMRGISFLQIPTTLLAMVDSSVGGKTGVNLPQGKNLVGAFHQPHAVFIDPDTLHTLPERELRAGFAEVIKYGALGDSAFFAWLEQNVDALLRREPDALQHAIETSVRHKARIVVADEFERGERALLNLGHTFGHAIEAASAYTRYLHGEAVAIGMLAAARLSTALGMAAAEDAQRLECLLLAFGLPVRIPSGFDDTRLLSLMRLDKKAQSGKLRLILWRGIGQAEVIAGVADDAILSMLAGMH